MHSLLLNWFWDLKGGYTGLLLVVLKLVNNLATSSSWMVLIGNQASILFLFLTSMQVTRLQMGYSFIELINVFHEFGR